MTRFILDRASQQVHNDLAHRGDRVVFIGVALIALALFALIKTGVIA